MELLDLLQSLPFYQMAGEENPVISAIENDHRLVDEGALFICIKGYTFDGHTAAQEAVNRGAKAILAEREVEVTGAPVIYVPDTKRAMAPLADSFYGSPTHAMNLIGITGTNGKTTTSHLISEIFTAAGEKTGLIGTMYMKIGEEKIDTKNTTPESLTLQKTFKQMKDKNVTTAVMEVSSHALTEGRVLGCDYNVAVFTNLTQDHLDYHKTMDEYRQAKGLLFAQLGNTYQPSEPKFAVFNADDEATAVYKKQTAAHIVTYGIDQEAMFHANQIELTAKGTVFNLRYPDGQVKVTTQLAGKFNVYNTLAAIAAAYASGIEMSIILSAIKEIKGVDGRFELVSNDQGFAVVVDYAHTPDSLINVLKTVQPLTKGNVFAVVGCGGDRDRTKRPLMAQAACEHASHPIFTSDNPRSEDPAVILQDMEAGVEGKEYEVIIDRKEAIHRAVSQAKSGDVVVIAGKGHETYQIIGDEVLEFDDRAVAKEALDSRKKEEK
ncbi:UDP-N-acetylmuramoyl-L-alanyl-D-glutamate--2,6-diaminopimelate ligase [Bacillus ectoiniformans]|uniref:UDP-N-acetylmuramoyl-L-alanyl-D-glutamate--2, 6-diaminopimelate ligase n=1 Tax=Bacillus ectoiniformans TaxID=1494429 RepID=UPI00195CADD1|nr:UDP-N-acetylmuramoyl-L-alanyl-D-glutamate--2,6-diaminopimelate ligase [Bacillus ectoiniformans]MBM7647221.1 UDP-N-acetylmuramoyl-L-alanyl-D-glutamate--2,6-diaminopimelate ligase [Bacillus ectoiniformans]